MNTAKIVREKVKTEKRIAREKATEERKIILELKRLEAKKQREKERNIKKLQMEEAKKARIEARRIFTERRTEERRVATERRAEAKKIAAEQEKKKQIEAEIQRKTNEANKPQSKKSYMVTQKKTTAFPNLHTHHKSSHTEAIKIHGVDFQYDIFCMATGGMESGNNYAQSNEEKGIAFGIEKSKRCFGRWQMSAGVLETYGIKTPEQILEFLRSPALQNKIMRKYTQEHIDVVLGNNVFSSLIASGVKPEEILAAMHFMGSAPVIDAAHDALNFSNPSIAFFHKLKTRTDWLKTRADLYVKIISQKYQNLIKKIPQSASNKIKSPETQDVEHIKTSSFV